VVDNEVEYDLYTVPFPLGADAEEFHLPFFFNINLAVGGNFTDALQNNQVTANLPGKMLVDYVRVFRWNGYGEVGTGSGPIANAGPDIIQWDEDGNDTERIYLDGSSSSHHNGEITSFSWSIDGELVGDKSLIFLDLPRGNYTAILTVTDSNGNQATDEVLITISSGGLAPIANAGPDQSVEDDNDDDLVNVTLDGSLSEEVASPIVSYTWLENDIVLTTGVNPTIELSTGVHTIVLEVTDQDGLTATDEVVITVIDPNNILPTAVAGSDQTLNDDDDDDLVEVFFDGSNSSDTDGSIVGFLWEANGQEVGNEAVFSSIFSTGTYLIVLTVTDDDGGVNTDSFTLTVVDPDNLFPVAIAGDDLLVVDLDLDSEETVLLDASASTDSDGTIESYKWIENGTVIGSGIQYEATLSLGEHTITLELIDDDGAITTDEIIVIVNQLPVAIAGDDLIVSDLDSNGNQQVDLDASNSYDPDGTISSYSWIYNSAEIGNQSVVSYTFDVGVHSVILKVTDNYGSYVTDTLTLFVASLDNTPPVADAGEDISVYANIGSNQVSVELSGLGSSDADGFIYKYTWFKDQNEIATGSSPTVDFEIGTHEVQLEVTDNEGATHQDTVLVTVLSKINIALGKPVTVSSSEAQYTGNLAVDGDYETRWSSLFADPQWVVVDLENQYVINQVVLHWETASGRSYQIQISNDNNT
jgi:hypothetical protein